jgi:predicted component of type VI protein secretion system
MCVYQLSDPNAFNELRMDRGGIQQLLECKRFDKSVSSTDKVIVHPGDEETIVYDRAEDARFVGVAAGYYELWPEHVTRLVVVPVKVEVTGRFIRKKTAMPDKLELGLYLGPAEIQQILE